VRRRRHGLRIVHRLTLIEEVLSVLGAGQRLEILRALADGPKHVTLLAEELFLDVKVVSKDLERLETCGFVVSTKLKTKHVYALTHRVRALRQNNRVQLVIRTDSGRWFLVNFDDFDGGSAAVEPPSTFVSDL
jgi:DNA-binding HxlR family transcriptional regulator